MLCIKTIAAFVNQISRILPNATVLNKHQAQIQVSQRNHHIALQMLPVRKEVVLKLGLPFDFRIQHARLI